MSYKVARKVLEQRLAALTPALPTGYENAPFEATAGTAYQRAFLLPGKTYDPTMGHPVGQGLRRRYGVFSVKLFYPKDTGAGAAAARAELLCEHFPRGLVLVDGSVRVWLHKSTDVGQGVPEAGSYVLPVDVFFVADVQG